jgi:hypothetical protein
MTSYAKTSPYFSTANNGAYLDIITFRDIPSQVDDIPFTVLQQYTHRPDLLAYDLYNDANLWWVFAVRNKNVIKDPIYDMVAGTLIYLPKLSTINSALGL